MADETNEYPRMLHKGDAVDPHGYNHENLNTLIVNNGDEEEAARKEGYASLHEIAKPKAAKAKA